MLRGVSDAATKGALEDGGGRTVAYQALAQELRRELSEGAYAHGRQLPTEAELSAAHGVGRQTVRRALQDLVAEGLVYRVRGRGTFATPSTARGQYLRSFGSIDDLLAVAEDTHLEMVSGFERRADVEVAGRLQQSSDEVYTGVFRRLHGDKPFFLTHVHLPVDIGRGIVDSPRLPRPGQATGITIIALINELLPRPIVGAHQSITACPMPAEHAALIDVEPGSPVLRIDRVFFESDGRPVELATSYSNPSRYSYRVELRRAVGVDSV
jgi:DNA-binding GntR family transcriptional regulator